MISAIFSPDRKYRYVLNRIWSRKKTYVMFICLNPSTADERKNDPTVRRCIDFAYSWGFGGMVMTNLFAYRSTDPCNLYIINDPVGPDNDKHLVEVSRHAGLIIAAWGVRGTYRARDQEVAGLIKDLYCLGMTKEGQPKHPLYLAKTTEYSRMVK